MTLLPALPMMVLAYSLPPRDDRCRRGRIGGLEDLDLRAGREAVARAGPDPVVGALAGDLGDVVGPIVDVVGVAAGAAQHRIGAGAAIERVVAAVAEQHVRAVHAGERVVAISAMEAVGAPEALERVVAVHAHEFVDAVVSPQAVGVDRAGEVLDVNESISFSVAARSTDIVGVIGVKQDGHALG